MEFTFLVPHERASQEALPRGLPGKVHQREEGGLQQLGEDEGSLDLHQRNPQRANRNTLFLGRLFFVHADGPAADLPRKGYRSLAEGADDNVFRGQPEEVLVELALDLVGKDAPQVVDV
jgi:hypothetical protein